jgi:hypothetical protein
LPRISGVVPDAATTHLCHSFLTFDAPSRESEAKAKCSELFLLLLELCEFAVTLPKLNMMISQKTNRASIKSLSTKILIKPETRAQSFH